jgi:glycosyltransferase involved in cell wall biosynthesis
MDGGSTDGSVEIIRKFGDLLARGEWPVRCHGITFRWLSEKDKGQADAINKGFRMAGGKIVAWINSDDYYLSGAFKAAAAALETDRSLAMVYGDGFVAEGSSGPKRNAGVEPFFDLWKLIHLYDFVSQPSVFLSREAIEKAGYLDERLHYIMDWELWIRMSRFGKIRSIPQALSCARLHPGAKTGSAGMERWNEIRRCAVKYGQMTWPPAVFTQLFHKPLQRVMKAGSGKGKPFLSGLVGYARRMYYPLIRGNRSGLYPDGYVERNGALSLPLRKEVSRVVIAIFPVCACTLRYSVNNVPCGAISLGEGLTSLEISLDAAQRSRDFLHIRFRAGKSAAIPPLPPDFMKREGSFIIRSISMQREDGTEVSDIALPEFSTK